MIVIKNGRLVDAFTDIKADILLDDGKIKAIGENLEAEEVIDAKGKVVMPAFIDTHVHFRDPGFTAKEDLESGAHSALRGGFGTVNLMANTQPVVDNNKTYEDIMHRAAENDLVNIFQSYAVTKNLAGKEFVDFDSIPETVKFLSDDGHGLFNNKKTYDLFNILNERNLRIMIHEEDNEISPVDYRIAEDIDTIRDVYLSGKTNASVHFCHVSTIDSLKAIEYGKKQGYPVSLEVTPHHIYMHDSDFRVNPPIRTKEDVDYLIDAIVRGTVDCIATDHAPHQSSDKEAGAPGMIGLETAFSIVYKVLVEDHQQSLSLLSKMMSYGPAQVMELDKGRLEVGLDADLVIIDCDEKQTVTDFASKSANSPFIGEKFTGVIESTIVEGKVKYTKEKND